MIEKFIRKIVTFQTIAFNFNLGYSTSNSSLNLVYSIFKSGGRTECFNGLNRNILFVCTPEHDVMIEWCLDKKNVVGCNLK